MSEVSKDRSTEHVILLLTLLGFYGLAPVVFLVWGLSTLDSAASGSFENGMLVRTLATLAKDPGAYTGILQQMIMPVVVAVTAANSRAILDHPWSRWLFIVPLVGIIACLTEAVLIRSMLSEADLQVELAGATAGSISQLFLSSAGTLATYVMLMVGLQLAAPAQPEPVRNLEAEGRGANYPEEVG